MSGRKQHYIPQFFLRGFAESGKAKKAQVRVVTRERNFIASTEGVAAQREFYSKLGEDGSLDDQITKAETEYAAIYHRLIATPAGECKCPDDVARLLSHLTIRSGHMRDIASIFGHHAIRGALEMVGDRAHMRARFGIDLAEPNDEMRRQLDDIYNERKALASKAGLSRHEFRRKAFNELKTRWEDLFLKTVPEMKLFASMFDVSTLAKKSHLKALTQTIEPEKMVEKLASASWSIKEWNAPTLVLPDSVAIAHKDDVGAVPLFLSDGDELQSVLFPLSPRRALCAGSYTNDEVLKTLTANFFTFAAETSSDFVVAPPSFMFETAMASRIGAGVTNMLSRLMQEAMAELMADAIA